jgi:hypothetical protein
MPAAREFRKKGGLRNGGGVKASIPREASSVTSDGAELPHTNMESAV